MRDMLIGPMGQGPAVRDRVTLVETMVIVGAIGAFAAIYSYIVIAAINFNPWNIPWNRWRELGSLK